MIGVALYRGVSPLSQLIRWQTRSVYSHAAFIDLRTELVFEAWRGVGVRGWNTVGTFHTAGTVVDLYRLHLELFSEEADALRHWLSLQYGKRYDYAGVLRFVSRRPERNNERSWFCSELVGAGFAHIGRSLLSRVAHYELAPGHLAWSPLLRPCGKLVTGLPRTAPATVGVNGPRTRRAENRAHGAAEGLQAFCNSVARECKGIPQETLAMGGAA